MWPPRRLSSDINNQIIVNLVPRPEALRFYEETLDNEVFLESNLESSDQATAANMPARQLTDDELVGKFNGDLADWKETLADSKEADNVPEVLYTDFINTYTALRDTVKVLSRRSETDLATNFPEIKASA